MAAALVRLVVMGMLATRAAAAELDAFLLHEVVPDVIPAAPESLLSVAEGFGQDTVLKGDWIAILRPLTLVSFPSSGLEVRPGQEVLPSQVQDPPLVSWDADPEQYYTLCMTDPDAPGRFDATDREHRHWLVANIPGRAVAAGDPLTAFLPSHPPPLSGPHRYTFLVYRQSTRADFDEAWLAEFNQQRSRFSIAQFAHAHGMEGPVAGNFYTAQHES